jgi:hypothetical protein
MMKAPDSYGMILGRLILICPTRDLIEGYHIIGYRWTLSYSLKNYAIAHLNRRKLTKSSRSDQLAIDGKGLSNDSASVIILFPQKAKYVGDIN